MSTSICKLLLEYFDRMISKELDDLLGKFGVAIPTGGKLDQEIKTLISALQTSPDDIPQLLESLEGEQKRLGYAIVDKPSEALAVDLLLRHLSRLASVLEFKFSPLDQNKRLLNAQFSYEETIHFSRFVNEDDIVRLLEILPLATNPVLAHNLSDIIIESTGKHQSISPTGFQEGLSAAAKKLFKSSEHLPASLQLSIYEAVSNAALALGSLDEFEQFARKACERGVNIHDQEWITHHSWWGPRYFGGIQKATSAQLATLLDPSYGLVRIYTSSILEGLTGKSRDYYSELGDVQAVKFNIGQHRVRKESERVFLIHGGRKDILDDARRLVEIAGRTPVTILSESPNFGKTVIEKLEHYANECTIAMALYTKDDQIVFDDGAYFQGRPNVLFELGWCLARYGRERVILVVEEGAKIPNDLYGMVELRFTSELGEIEGDILEQIDSVKGKLYTREKL